MGLAHSPRIVADWIELYLDAGNTKSYPGSGTTWKDLSGNGYDFTLSNSGSFNTDSDGIKNMNFLSSYCSRNTDVPPYDYATLMCFTKILASTSNWRTLTRGASSSHHVIVENGSNDFGAFWGIGIKDSGYDIDSVPNYDSKYNCLTFKLSTSSPYWQFQYNDSAVVATITDSAASYNNGFAAIGGYHDGNATNSDAQASQYWGNIGVFLYYKRHLSQSEILQNFNALRGRFGI